LKGLEDQGIKFFAFSVSSGLSFKRNLMEFN
jgi:hypothetical protein